MGLLDKLRLGNKVKINAVHPEDLDSFLKSIDKWEPIQNGEIYCSVCGRKITPENIGKVCPKKTEIPIRCDLSSCIFGISGDSPPSDTSDSTEDVDGKDSDEDETEEVEVGERADVA